LFFLKYSDFKSIMGNYGYSKSFYMLIKAQS
jgi:hypothetical protein